MPLEHVARREIPVAQVSVQNTTRPMIVGPDTPEPPYPIALVGAVQKGFGRGGKDLGCPTGLRCSSEFLSCLMQTFFYSKFTR